MPEVGTKVPYACVGKEMKSVNVSIPTVLDCETAVCVHLGDATGTYNYGMTLTGDIPIEGEVSLPIGTFNPVFESPWCVCSCDLSKVK